MPPSPERHRPRHADVDRPRWTVLRATTVGGLVLALVIGGSTALAGASFTDALAAVRDLRGTGRPPTAAAQPPAARDEPAAAPVAGTTLRPRFRVVEATRLRAAPEKPTRRPARSALAVRAERASEAPAIAEFGVAMFNILGSNHTRGGKGGYASGVSRARTATSWLLGRGVSIVGFSEIQSDQLNVFLANAPAFAAYPGTSLGGKGVPQSVAWDTRVWRLVEATQIYIPFSGQIRPQPVVRLANVASGTEIWVMNVHNSPNHMEGERDRAESIEIARINELVASGLPVVVTGDFNEKQEVLCRITAATGLVSAVGGGSCYPPPQQMRVDWIFASPAFTLGSYTVTREAPVPSITDHAVLFSRLSLS